MVLEIVQDKLLGIFKFRVICEVVHLLNTLIADMLYSVIKSTAFLSEFKI